MRADYLLVLDKIQGEQQDADFPQSIAVKTWSYSGAAPSDVASGLPTGKVQISDLIITKDLDRASPMLLEFMINNRPIPNGKLICRKAGGSPLGYYTIKLTKARIRSVSTKAGQGQAGVSILPEETVAISYGKIAWEYGEQQRSGSLGAGTDAEWDNNTAR